MILNGSDQYPSRQSEEVTLIERHHDVVHGSVDDGPLTAEQLVDFEAGGFVALDGCISREQVAAVVAELDALVADDDVRADPACVLDGDEVDTLFDLPRLGEQAGRLLRDDRLAGAARQLLGSEVTLHQSRVNHAPGRVGTAVDWHADFEAFHVQDGMPTPRAVGMAIALIDRPDHDPMLLIPGSHYTYVTCLADDLDGDAEGYPTALPDTTSLAILADRHGISSWGGDAGSVILFDVNLMVARNSGATPTPRSHLFAVYNAVENALQDPFGPATARPAHVAARDAAPLPHLHSSRTS